MNILIIEDDEFFWNKIIEVFKKRVITNKITLLSSYEEYLHMCHKINNFDIILVDINIPSTLDRSWIDIIQDIRDREIATPTIVISGYDQIEYIERAFDSWANDYLTKPFRLKELEIRIMRWFKSYCMNIMFSNTQTIAYKKLHYDFKDNSFYYKWEPIELTKKSKFILFQFLLQKESVLSEWELCDKIWWDREVLKERNIRIVILRLKNALKQHGIDSRIQNIRWEGYILKK